VTKSAPDLELLSWGSSPSLSVSRRVKPRSQSVQQKRENPLQLDQGLDQENNLLLFFHQDQGLDPTPQLEGQDLDLTHQLVDQDQDQLHQWEEECSVHANVTALMDGENVPVTATAPCKAPS